MVRVPLAMHVDQPELRERGEHRRTRADHDPETSGRDVEPRAVPGALVSPRGTGRRRRRTRRRSRRPSRGSGRRPGRSPPPFALPRSPRPRTRRRPTPRQPVRGGPRRLRSPRGASRAAAGHSGSRPRPLNREVSRAPRDALTRVRGPTLELLGRDTRRDRPSDHRGERSHVALAQPPVQRERALVERTDRRDELADAEHPLGHVLGRSQHPGSDLPTVERDLDQRPDAGTELFGELVGEGTIEREQRPVDADRDGSRQVFLLRDRRGARDRGRRVTRTRGGAHPRGRSPPRGTPCGRNGRRRPCPRRSDGADPCRG